jgi:cytochrome c556
MPMTRLATFSFAAIAALGTVAVFADDLPVVDPAIAGMTADQKVEARQAAMKEDGMLLKGAGTATGDDAVKIVDKVLQNFTNFSALFADGATNDKSHASPKIWTEWDKFTAILDKGKATLVEMRTAAVAGDTAAYMASIKTLGGVCGECHMQYREKD